MQIAIRQHIDFFKVFKIMELKKIDKHGDVKLVQDKVIGRKVLSVEGSVSTQNYIIFDCADAAKSNPSLCFSQRYLYVIGWAEFSKVFCFQITARINTRVCKALYSTVHKAEKMSPQAILHLPLELKSGKWSIIAIDLHDLCAKFLKSNEARLNFEVSSIEIRAHSRVKNIYLSDNLYDPTRLPKEMQLPLLTGESFYSKYAYFLSGTQQPLDQTIMPEHHIKLQQTAKCENRNSSIQVQENIETSLQSKTNKGTNQLKTVKSTRPIKKIVADRTDRCVQNIQNQGLAIQDQVEDFAMVNKAPRPLTTIDLKLCAVQGHSLYCWGVRSLGAFIISPSIFAVHEPIKCMSIHMSNNLHLVVGYESGCICIWDMVRQKPMLYLKTELVEIKQIVAKGTGEDEKIYVVGFDKMKRETILIANSREMLFRQISNYSINQFLLCPCQSQQVIVSFGFENIRLWKMNEINHIITGTGLYLGKLNRLVTYTSACTLPDGVVLVVDNSGYITTFSLSSQKVQRVQRISENGLDRILHIPQLNGVLIAESSGTLKLLSYDLEVLQHYDIGNRVRSMFYKAEEGSIKLHLAHFNSSTAVFSVADTCYQYESSQHTSQVLSLSYNSGLNRLVSIAKDNTIRVWALWPNQSKKTQLQYSLKQQYEFLINNGETMTSMALDRTVYAYVGFEGGLIRKINIQKYVVEDQKSFAFADEELQKQLKIAQIKVSKNNRHLLVSVRESSKSGYVVLSDESLDIRYKYNPPNSECWGLVAGFSETHKKAFICWSYGNNNRFQVFSLNDNIGQVCSQFYLQSPPISIRYLNEFVQVDAVGMCELYSDDGELIKAINIGNQQHHDIRMPLIALDNSNSQLQLKILEKEIQKNIDVPESINNISIFSYDQQNNNDLKGLIFFTGQKSHSIYAAEFMVRNAGMGSAKTQKKTRESKLMPCLINQTQNDGEEEEELQCAEKKMIGFSSIEDGSSVQKLTTGHQTQLAGSKKQQFTFPKHSQPFDIQGLYENQHQLYSQCKSALQLNYSQQNLIQISQGEQNIKSQRPLIFGWSSFYSATRVGSEKVFWDPSSQSALFLSQNMLILHYFKEPVRQKIVRLPIRPDLVIALGKNHICVALGNQLRLFTASLHHMRSCSTMGDSIKSVCLSKCEGYLVVVCSSNSKKMNYIQVIDVVTGSTVCSTYRTRIDGPCRVECNPHQQCLQFMVHSEKGVSFYRLTSILTLQTQQLEQMPTLLSSSAMGGICCARYLKLAADEVILLGMSDGSLILVDSRSNSIMMVFKKIYHCSILDIHSNSNAGQLSLVLITDSSNILGYELTNVTLNDLVFALDKPPSIKLSTDSELTLHSNLERVGDDRLAMLAMSRLGILWLIDFTGHDTIKVLSVHGGVGAGETNTPITKALAMGDKQISVISGSVDGTVKQTSLKNLEQINEIYRPRRCVCDILLVDELLIVAFAMELYFYKIEGTQEWKFIGSVDLMECHIEPDKKVSSSYNKRGDLKVVGIRNIAYSDNFVVCTSSSLFMLYYQKILSQQTQKLKVEIKQLWRAEGKAQGLELMGYNYILVRETSKISLLARKQKRGQPVLQQLSRLDELVYYMADVSQVDASCAKFTNTKNSREYIFSLSGRPIIQWRDFEQHCIVREIQVTASNITTFELSRDGRFLVGDEEGTLWSIKGNGLTLNKTKMFDSPVQGIMEMVNGQVMAYGPSIFITNI